jgi:hypothetical protein
LNHHWRVYAVMVTFCCCTQKHLSAMPALTTRDPVRTTVCTPHDAEQFNSGLARLKFLHYKNTVFFIEYKTLTRWLLRAQLQESGGSPV